jgi:yecA family protein
MTAALCWETGPSAPEFIDALGAAKARPDELLRLAVGRAAEIAPAVIDIVGLAASGVYLLPAQRNVVFWGIHILAAARRTELFDPLLRLLRRSSENDLDDLLGDATTETLAGILLSLFDGNATALMESCLDGNVDGTARWMLLLVLARLTFDGAVPREVTIDLLERFEREQRAEPGSDAWMGWQDAVVLLGVETLRERMHATWRDGRNPQRKVDQDGLDLDLSKASAMAPGDPGLFIQHGIEALSDPVAALGWIAKPAAPARNEPLALADFLALDAADVAWLNGFFERKCGGLGLLEFTDGYFCGSIAGPGTVQFDISMSVLWERLFEEHEECLFDSHEQQQYVTSLLTRHWNTIVHRLDGRHHHHPLLDTALGEAKGAGWASGFVFAITQRMTDWDRMKGDDYIAGFILALSGLAGHEEFLQRRLSAKECSQLLDILPLALQRAYDHCHGRIDRLARPSFTPELAAIKIGRNEPCPCGSGKKYKRCCGSPLHDKIEW